MNVRRRIGMNKNIAFLAIPLVWITGLVCGTILILNDHPWWALAIMIVACSNSIKVYTEKNE
jgi:hypothetical protein